VVAQQIFFGILAAMIAISAVRVVTASNIVHCALYLTVVLAGIAGIYILLAAEFVFAVQLLVYIGAIVVLFLFGIMLTRAPLGRTSNLDNNQKGIAAVVALFLFGALGSVLYNAFHGQKLEITDAQRTAVVGLDIFSKYVIPFEVVSVVLLAALVGAVVIARRD
jgi:NADH-quinone oxidoreductase subunit J